MKIFYLIIFVFLLTFIGCSSTYKVSDFSSKEKFYDDFNKSVIGKDVKIILSNDSSFTLKGTKISDDSITYFDKTQKGEKIIGKSEIRNIHFYFNQQTAGYSADISLNTGEELKENNVELLPDSSIKFIESKNILEYIPLSKVKNISYRNNLLGVPIGFLSGSVLGILGSFMVYAANLSKDEGNLPVFYVIPVIGAVAGSVWGWFNGYTFIYQFNP